MREILFRGKRTDNYKEVEGFFARYEKRTYIIEMVNFLVVNWHEVIPETVGQYIGLEDKNHKRIFENDIVMFRDYTEPAVVKWDKEEARYYMVFSDCMIDFYPVCSMKEIEVVGNIHDNPNLLGGDQ